MSLFNELRLINTKSKNLKMLDSKKKKGSKQKILHV